MRYFLLVLFTMIMNSAAFATGTLNARNIPEINHHNPGIPLKILVKLTAEEYGKLRGKKLNFFERLAFKSAQKKLKRQLTKGMAEDETEGFHLGGYLLGLILGPFGVLGAYIFSTDRNLRKWAWWGFLGWFALLLLTFNAIMAG